MYACILFASCGAFDGFSKGCACTRWLSSDKGSWCVSWTSWSGCGNHINHCGANRKFCTLGNVLDTTHTARKLRFKLDHMLRLSSGCLDAVWQPESWWRQCADPWRVPLIVGFSRVFHVFCLRCSYLIRAWNAVIVHQERAAHFEFWTALNQVAPVCHSTPKRSVLVAHILLILTNPRVIGLGCRIILLACSLSPHCESDTATLVHCHQLQVYRGLFAAERACQIGRSASLKHRRHETRTSRPVAGLIRIPMCSSVHHWATCHLKTTSGDMTCAP